MHINIIYAPIMTKKLSFNSGSVSKRQLGLKGPERANRMGLNGPTAWA
jgi:hypothetical protein